MPHDSPKNERTNDLMDESIMSVFAYQHELRGFLHGFVDAWEDTGATIGEGIEAGRDRHTPNARDRKGVCEPDVIRGGRHDDPGEKK